MKNPRRWFRWLAALLLLAAGSARAQYYSYSNRHTFSGPDGAGPEGTLIQGSDGNFYGTTAGSDASTSNTADAATNGTVFQLTPGGVLTTLHVFAGTDGAHPQAPLVQLSNGLLYGTTSGGFSGSGITVFCLATDGSGFKTLARGGAREGLTNATLAKGADGNLYGTDRQGGTQLNDGSIFRMTPEGAVTILYSFQGYPDGEFPNGPLFQANDGNFYGCTGGGGAGREGAVFRISPAGAYALIYSLAADGSDGSGPNGLVQASDGYLYGTCDQGGDPSDPPSGTVFRVTLTGAFTKLFDSGAGFGDGPPRVVDSVAALIVGPDGALYGTGTEGGETGTAHGGVFRVGLDGSYSPVYAFDGVDGAYPFGGLLLASDGNFYGTTAGTIAETDPTTGGDEYGTVFKLTVSSHPPFFAGETALSEGVYYLQFPNGNLFGYYEFLSDPNYLYHFDLGFEYVFDANDGQGGVYFYDFKSDSFFYTSPVFPFPYLYDFTLNSFLYYYPDPNNPGHYNTDGVRYFYDFDTGTIIMQ